MPATEAARDLPQGSTEETPPPEEWWQRHVADVRAIRVDMTKESDRMTSLVDRAMASVSKLTKATKDQSDQFLVLSSAVKVYTSTIETRLDDLKESWEKRCVLKHEGVNHRLAVLEQGEHDLDKAVDEMGEITKVQKITSQQEQIADLQAQIDSFHRLELDRQKKESEAAEKAKAEVIENTRYWRRYRVTVYVAIGTCLLGAALSQLAPRIFAHFYHTPPTLVK